jgi:tRNA modification GTPase
VSTGSSATTIAAIATGTGGGVGIVRVSGPEAIAIAAAMLGLADLADRRVVFGVARGADGGRLDDVLAFAMRAPRSFTGEDVAEIHGHGGAVNLGRLLREVLARGAVPAEPGEFTRRAFENGKLDLTRAEALLGVIEAGSERAWRVAQAQLSGALGERVEALRQQAVALLAEIEAGIDFPEDDLTIASEVRLAEQCAVVATGCDTLAATFRVGRALRRGVEVAIVGPVNAGKSSLFNALLGKERALVSAEPGTTRDYVEATVEWDGVAVTLIDTAGWRVAADGLERRGIELGERRVEEVDVVLVASDEPVELPADASWAVRAVRVRTKADLGGAGDGLSTSARTGAGLVELRSALLAAVGVGGGEDEDGVIVTSERQRQLLAQAADRFQTAHAALIGGAPVEMAALDVRDGTRCLAQLVGVEVGEAVLDELFARFCIGK